MRTVQITVEVRARGHSRLVGMEADVSENLRPGQVVAIRVPHLRQKLADMAQEIVNDSKEAPNGDEGSR